MEKNNYPPKTSLSPKELEVVGHMIDGLSNRMIGVKMGILESSVKFHCTNIFKKLGYKSRSELIANYYNPELAKRKVVVQPVVESEPRDLPGGFKG